MSLSAALLREARPKQWVKNVLVFAAAGAAGLGDNGEAVMRASVMFVAFCLAASGTYYWNDILDVDNDRQHPTKKDRPIASGAVPVGVARLVGVGLLAAAIGVGFAVNWRAGMSVVVYVAMTVMYSAWLKHVAVVDLITVAAGFVVRAIAGGLAIDVPLSTWFLLTTSFGSLFIVTGRRYAELREVGEAANTRATLDQYSLGYLRMVLSVSCCATLVNYCIWAFDRKELSGTTGPFYELSILPMAMALLRYLLVLEQGHGSAPEEIFLSDRTLQSLGVLWAATFALGVYLP